MGINENTLLSRKMTFMLNLTDKTHRGDLMYKILEKTRLNADVDRIVINAPLVAKNAKPGNFLILRVDEKGERIPMTITEHDERTVTIMSQRVGYSTRLLGMKKTGDTLHDVVGPLGQPAKIHDVKSVIGIAGGVGAAPLYPQMKAYAAQGVTVDLIIGAKDEDHLLLLDEYKSFCKNVYVATDDGSLGKKGFVTLVAEDVYTYKTYDRAVVIGPLIMMKNMVELNQKHNLKTDVSLNPIMIDGTGMCGGCRVTIDGKSKFACMDGPDFPADGIDFEEMIARQRHYEKEEKHICRIKLGDDHDTKTN